MRRPGILTIAVGIAALYGTAVAVGMHVRTLAPVTDIATWTTAPSAAVSATAALRKPAWRAPSPATIPAGPLGDSIRRGAMIFNETYLYAPKFATAKVSCAACHAEGGIQPFASPVVGVQARFPQFNERAGHIISLEDRIQECFVRSENGQPLDYKGPEMRALVAYITWLSTPQPDHKPYVGKGLIDIPTLTPDPNRGRVLYANQCMGCHGSAGEGKAPQFPPIWGPYAFNDGAGMHGVKKMAAFVQHNMPQNRMGILTPQQAWDVSAFIHEQPRPAFNPAYKHF